MERKKLRSRICAMVILTAFILVTNLAITMGIQAQSGYHYIIDTAASYHQSADKKLYAEMKKGTIHMEAINKKADEERNYTKWRTLGFYITTEPLQQYTYQGYTGYKTLQDTEAILNQKIGVGADFLYSDRPNCVTRTNDYGTDSDGNELVQATYDFNGKAVYKLLKKFNPIDLKKIEGPTLIYLQPIFQAYYVDSKGNESILEDCDYIKDWKKIFNAAHWGNPSDFQKYYNIKLNFSPGKQPVKVTYVYKDLKGDIIDEVLMDSYEKYINDDLKTLTPEVTCKYNEKSYSYEKCDATTAYENSSDGFDEVKLSEVKTEDHIIINALVEYGGVHVKIYYKEDEKKEDNEYVRELNDATHTEIGSGGSLDSLAVGEYLKWEFKNSQYCCIKGTWAECENQSGSEVYDLVGVYVTRKSDGKIVLDLTGDSIPLSKMLKNKVKVEERGMIVHLVYEGQTVNQWVREWSNGQKFDQGVFSTEAIPGEKLYYSVKAKIKLVSDGRWKEYTLGSTEDYYDLIRVYVENSSKQRVKDVSKDSVSTMTELCNGNVTIEEGGMTVHYVYEKPIITPTPTIPPTIPKVVVPEHDELVLDLVAPTALGRIRADERGGEKFTATIGVPTTESLFVEVKGTKYLLGCNLQKKTGKITFSVPVRRKVTMIWKNVLGTKTKTETYTYETVVQITRAYGYWEIQDLNYYTIDSTEVSNYALPGGSVTIQANNSQNPIPDINYSHDASFENHVIYPSQKTMGVDLPEVTIYGDTERPSYTPDQDDITAEVNGMVDPLTVKNDYLNFNGTDVIPNKTCFYDTGYINKSAIYQTDELCNEDVLYQNDYVIEAEKLNGTYYSNGMIYYRQVAAVNGMTDMFSYAVQGLNKVVVHTPVLCKPIVSSDNDKYVQLINPTEDCTELVLDEDPTLNDFTLQISNYGSHSYQAGYFTRDFSYNLHGWNGISYSSGDASYIKERDGALRNEVKFPFDVYMHLADGTTRYVAKNTWIIIGRSTVKFHLPMWVNDGVYTVDCRTVAVNCNDSLISKEETFKNSSLDNYVATNTFNVEVSGRIYGMKIYEVTNDVIWDEVFREYQSLQFKRNHPDKYVLGVNMATYSRNYIYDYAAGTNDQYGNSTDRLQKYTFPLVAGSHPYFKNEGMTSKGYAFRFSLETVGSLYSDACKVVIKPSFWYVDREGKGRTQVDIYYDEDINGKLQKLVKIGSSLDLINLKQIRTGDVYLGIPKDELSATALLKNIDYKKYVSQVEAMFTFGNIKLNHAFRTFVNQDYTKKIQRSADAANITAKGITASDIDIRKQRWYGEWYLPGAAHAAKSGVDVIGYASNIGVDYSEDFWLKDGYIIVNFDIYTVDQDGNQRLSYTNATNYLNNGNCCMWSMEGFQLEKIDYYGTKFNFKIGDVFVYDGTRGVNDDYVVGGTH